MILDQFNVQLIGANADAIDKAETATASTRR